MNILNFVFQRTFQYTSCIWTNKNGYNLAGGKTGFDTQETKLPTYWETNFSKICLGMKIGNQTNFLFFELAALTFMATKSFIF